ncbi:MAG: ROK family protein [Barnesiella sp.]
MKPYVLGIDIGGTNSVFGIVDARGTILASGSIKTQKYAAVEDYVNDLCNEILKLVKQEDVEDKIEGVGVGAPNGNYFNGTIEYSPNLPWKGIIPLAQMLENKLKLPVTITNDANAAAIGEMTYGAARGIKDFIMITLGTGVGSGIVVNGQLVYGHDGFAGELGHVIMRRQNGRLCGCGRTGCLEAYTSATELPERHGNFWKSELMSLLYVCCLFRTSHLKMFMKLLCRVTSWLSRYLIIPGRCWEKLLPIL